MGVEEEKWGGGRKRKEEEEEEDQQSKKAQPNRKLTEVKREEECFMTNYVHRLSPS